jgi:hypothetical protein
MQETYDSKSFGYDKLSKQEALTTDASDDTLGKLREEFLRLPCLDATELATVLYQLPYFSKNTLEDYTGLTKDDLRALVKFITNNHLVERTQYNDYRRLPLGTKLFENLTEVPITKIEVTAARKTFYSSTDY